MKFSITSKVNKDFDLVKRHFDSDLFKALTPPLMQLKIVQFDSIKIGAKTEIILYSFPLSQHWLTEITEKIDTQSIFQFVDKGIKIPFPFSYWEHRHVIEKAEKGVIIKDIIEVRAKNQIMFAMLLPGLYFAMLYRKFAYKNYFKNK